MSVMKCKQCGAEAEGILDYMTNTCDLCGAFICPACFNKIEPAFINAPSSKKNLTGFVRLCDECLKKTNAKTITEHPYIG